MFAQESSTLLQAMKNPIKFLLDSAQWLEEMVHRNRIESIIIHWTKIHMG